MELKQNMLELSSFIQNREQEILAIAQQNTKETVEKEMALLDFELLLSANLSEGKEKELTERSRLLRKESWNELSQKFDGNYDKIDLELFHASLLCYILVEIKTEPFQHKHVSQMYSYLNWYKEHKQQKGQRPPIGLIICKTKDEETVHYALGDLKKEIFIAEYSTKLPTKEKIARMLQ